MALKDWKVIYEGRLMLRYKNQKKGNILEIYPEKIRGKSVYFIAMTDKNSIRDKEFKTKTQALAFAKAYMRKH